MLYNWMLGAVAIAAVLVGASSGRAAVVGTVDDFQDLTPMGWSGFDPLITIKGSGGPLGVGDAYMRVSSAGGAGPGSRLATDNEDPRWVGNYLSDGLTSVEADFLNFGTTPLEMRAVVFNGNSNRYTSTIAGLVPADGLWHHLVFSLDSGSMTNVLGALTYNQIMSDVTAVMFRHDDGTPDAGGTTIVTTMGIDNIQSVPAPGAAVLAVAGALAMGRRSRRRGA